MEVPILRTIMVLLHLLHTTIVFYQDQWAEVVPSRAPHAALEGCSNMQMVPRGFSQKRAKTTKEVNLTLRPRTTDYGRRILLFPFLHPHVVYRQQVLEAVQPEDHARTTTTQPSRDTTVTTETTIISPPARNTVTRLRMCRHWSPLTASALRRDGRGGGGRGAPQHPLMPPALQRGGRFLGSGPTAIPLDHRSILTQWWAALCRSINASLFCLNVGTQEGTISSSLQQEANPDLSVSHWFS